MIITKRTALPDPFSEDRKRDRIIRHNLKLVDESNARTLAIIAEFEQPMLNQCTGGMAR